METFATTITKLPEGHPVKVYYAEKELIDTILTELFEVDASEDFQKYYNIFNQLSTIEKRFVRKENQLFPYLEKHGWDGPSKGMWSFHDTLRAQLKLMREFNEAKNVVKIEENKNYLIEGIRRLLLIEDERLFPNAMDLLSEEEWKEFYIGDEEIGWMLPQKPTPYPAPKDTYVHPSEDFEQRDISFSLENTFHYDEGYMTPEQVNLIFRFLPMDLTYVDENDKVVFYNRGDDRVFSRSKGIIGREVRFCHPPKSVGMVLQIIDEFRAGTKDVADFWFTFKDRCIYIRYFAIRDNEKNYRGVLEMSQDITDIKNITGEKRLLDWE